MDVVKDIEENVEEIAEEVVKPKIKVSKKKSDKDIEVEAEAESLATEKPASLSLDAKKKALFEKAAKLREQLTEASPSSEDLKEQIKSKKKADMLIPLDEYVKSGIYLGTKVVTPSMKPFVYRRRADGLAIFNTDIIDEKLKEGIAYISKFNAEDIILTCKRQAGWKAAKMFAHFTGIKTFTKKYPAGILTNTDLPNFFENELTIICDSWLDKNAFKDTKIVKKKVLMICDTNNFSQNADEIIIGNNKSAKSLGLIFYLLAKGYMKAKGQDTSKLPDLEYWTGEKE